MLGELGQLPVGGRLQFLIDGGKMSHNDLALVQFRRIAIEEPDGPKVVELTEHRRRRLLDPGGQTADLLFQIGRFRGPEVGVGQDFVVGIIL